MKKYNPNILVRFLDWLCGFRNGESRYIKFLFVVIVLGIVFTNLVPFVGLLLCGSIWFDFVPSFKVWLVVTCIWVVMKGTYLIFPFDIWYRYYRNRYLNKHNYPGPFIVGTIDDKHYITIYYEQIMIDFKIWK